jgi:hypothetical protein
MSDDDKRHATTATILRLGSVLIGMRGFAEILVAHGRAGGSFDDDTLAEIAATCVRDMKNTEIRGLPLKEEAQVVGDVAKDLDDLIQTAIRGAARR